MPIYDFSFAPPAAGKTCTVIDETGETIGSGTVPSSTGLDGAVTLSLPLDASDDYIGFVGFNQGATWFTNGVLNVVASIAAGGGGGVIIDADSLLFEINEGVTATPDGLGAPLQWDTVPDGQTVVAGVLTSLPPGLYHCSVELDFAQPAEGRAVSVMFNSTDSIVSPNGPFPLSSDGGLYGYTAFATGMAIVREGGGISVSLATSSLGAETPVDLVIEYAALTVTTVG